MAAEAAPGTITVEVIMAWPRRHLARRLRVKDGTTVAGAVATAEIGQSLLAQVDGYAIHGMRVPAGERLRNGDRLELLRPMQLDPKEARRRRAAS